MEYFDAWSKLALAASNVLLVMTRIFASRQRMPQPIADDIHVSTTVRPRGKNQ
jgi:hypothetical protein